VTAAVRKASYEEVARLLEEGCRESDAELAYRLGGEPAFIARVRASLGMPPRRLPSPHARLSLEERLIMFSEPLPGGHRRWLGTVEGDLPIIGRRSVPCIVFRREYAREPEGWVRTTCGVGLCIAGPHLADSVMRGSGEVRGPGGGRPVDEELRLRVVRYFQQAPEDVPATTAVAAELGVDRRIVAEVRAALRIPRTIPERQRPKVWTREAVEALMVPVEGGHRRWTGDVTRDGVPILDRRTTVARFVFRLTYGREPEGQVRTTCERKHCVAGEHLRDRLMRDAPACLDAAGGVR
jgi:hypothetical protein